jgi:UDP-glucose 4-epimerase
MRILVTGGLGNLGTPTLHQLVQHGHDVHSFDLPTPANQRKARQLSKAIQWQWGDIRDHDAVARSVAGMDVVVHQAGVIRPPAHDQPELAEAVNVGGTSNLLTQAGRQQLICRQQGEVGVQNRRSHSVRRLRETREVQRQRD